jgi:hypothetical protein
MGCIYTESKNYPREPAAHVAISEKFSFHYSSLFSSLVLNVRVNIDPGNFFLIVSKLILSIHLSYQREFMLFCWNNTITCTSCT